MHRSYTRRQAMGGLCASVWMTRCSGNREPLPSLTIADLKTTPRRDIVERARGTRVSFGMWAGDEERNRYFRGPVTAALKQHHGIDLTIVPCSDTSEIVNKLMNERGASKTGGGSVDIIWINGENFRTARQGNLLWGPFADFVPGSDLYPETARRRDFGSLIDGYEVPWQRAQFVLAYDTARVPKPPRSLDALQTWIKTHPGRFTYVAPPDFTGSAFVRHILVHSAEIPAHLQAFHESLYRQTSEKAIRSLNDIKPHLWRKGETYPATTGEMDRLFANREIDFSMAYGPAFASARIERGEYPPTTRTFVFDSGTLGNYSYLAIPFNATNIPGALVTIGDFISVRRVFELSRELKSPFPLRLDVLTSEQRAQVDTLPRGIATLPDSTLAAHYLPEPHAEYLVRFERDWRDKVLRQ